MSQPSDSELKLAAAMSRASKTEAWAVLSRIQKGEFGQKLKLRSWMNGRGDYGYTDLYLTTDGKPILQWSIDGARSDGWWYVGNL